MDKLFSVFCFIYVLLVTSLTHFLRVASSDIIINYRITDSINIGVYT